MAGPTLHAVTQHETDDNAAWPMHVAQQGAEWTVADTGAPGEIAQATKAAVTNRRHYITAIRCSFDAAHIDVVHWSGGTVHALEVHNQVDILFDAPLVCDSNTIFASTLNVTSFNGRLSIEGFTA